MEELKIKKEYRDFHVELEKSIAERLYEHCERTDDKIISVFRRSLKLYLDTMEPQQPTKAQSQM